MIALTAGWILGGLPLLPSTLGHEQGGAGHGGQAEPSDGADRQGVVTGTGVTATPNGVPAN